MFDRLATGWELAKQSAQVLWADKKLLLFPLVSGLACLLVLGSFVLPLWHSPYANVVLENHQLPHDPLAYAILFAFYFVNYFVILYFNSALVACAILRLKGSEPTLGDGFHAANACLPQILGWALVTATVGLILKVIESRSEKVGQIVAGLLGAAWSITTYFVVPILVVERKGPVEAFTRSLAILKKAWGESLTANFSVSSILFLIGLVPMLLAIGLGAMGIASDSLVLTIAGFGLLVVFVLLLSLISTTLHTIILAALYVYAAEGSVPEAFEGGQLEAAFQAK